MSVPLVLQQLTADTPPASWWQLAPYIAIGLAAIAVGTFTSRKGPRS